MPILIQVELKDEPIAALPTRPVPFDLAMIDAVDAEILSVFARSEIITPDRIRGQFATLPEAIHAHGWPALDEVRGQVLFALDNEGSIRDRYLEGHPALNDRVMFATVAPDHPAAAWFKLNDPIKDFDRIQHLVREGFLVRTRADADTRQARSGDVVQRDKALASGAQYISTDYPRPDRRFSDYSVRFADGQSRPIQPGERRPRLGTNRSGEKQTRPRIEVIHQILSGLTYFWESSEAASLSTAWSHAFGASVLQRLVATRIAKSHTGASQIVASQVVLLPPWVRARPPAQGRSTTTQPAA